MEKNKYLKINLFLFVCYLYLIVILKISEELEFFNLKKNTYITTVLLATDDEESYNNIYFKYNYNTIYLKTIYHRINEKKIKVKKKKKRVN